MKTLNAQKVCRWGGRSDMEQSAGRDTSSVGTRGSSTVHSDGSDFQNKKQHFLPKPGGPGKFLLKKTMSRFTKRVFEQHTDMLGTMV